MKQINRANNSRQLQANKLFVITKVTSVFTTSILLFLFVITSCKSTQTPVIVNIDKDHHTLNITGIDYAAIAEMQPDSTGSLWQNLVPVYKMPADTDMKDYLKTQPGRYKTNGNIVAFIPDTPFIKNQLYFVRYYRYGQGTNVLDAAKNGNKLGSIPYTDLIFKY